MAKLQYTSTQNVKDYIGKTVGVEYDVMISRWIDAMTSFIDKETNHFPLVVDPTLEDQTKKYDGKNDRELFIDNIIKDNITSLTINETAVTEFEIESNYAEGGYELYVESGISSGRRNVVVIGKFGKFALVPDDIEFACTVIVAGILNNTLNEQQEVRSETIGRYSVAYASSKQNGDFNMAKQILQDYRKITVL